MAGVDRAVALGLADPDRLGCCGLSFGGYETCWAVGHTARFKAAVPENPLTNWYSMYLVGDMSAVMAAKMIGGATPFEDFERYRRCSPITYAHRCVTPTLLIQGESDYRCPAEQSEQFYTALKATGCVVEMLRLPGSPHGGAIGGPLPSRRAQNEALLDWMNRWVLEKKTRPGMTALRITSWGESRNGSYVLVPAAVRRVVSEGRGRAVAGAGQRGLSLHPLGLAAHHG